MKTLFPMPRNRRKPQTDENALLHAICIAIRDKSPHWKLRALISHLPKIMNRVTPYSATQEENLKLREELRVMTNQCVQLRAEFNALASVKKIDDMIPAANDGFETVSLAPPKD